MLKKVFVLNSKMEEDDLRLSDFMPIVGLSNYQGRNSEVKGDSEWQKHLVKKRTNLLKGYNLAAYLPEF